jgi:hypothetical protein
LTDIKRKASKAIQELYELQDYISPKKHVIALKTPLPSRNVVLNVTHNKEQRLEMITEEHFDRTQGLISPNNLVVTGKADIPFEIRQGERVERLDLRTDHEEADVIIPHQVVQFA